MQGNIPARSGDFEMRKALLAFLHYMLISSEQKRTLLFVLYHLANILVVTFLTLLLTVIPAPHVLFFFALVVAETLLLIRFQFSESRTVNVSGKEGVSN